MRVHYTLDYLLKRLYDAPIVAPRGRPTKELEDVIITLEPGRGNILEWPSKLASTDYLKRELTWYVKGDRYDLSICDHAKIWAEHVENNVLESQYGHYWFRDFGLMRAAFILAEDTESRRAVVPMISARHIRRDAKDVPCTLSISFRIRGEFLNASVHMRSQDAVFGLRNDYPAFAMLQEILARFIGKEIGTLAIHVDSFHVYQRHFALLEKIAFEQPEFMRMPRIDESFAELALKGSGELALKLDTPFAEWLRNVPT